MASVFDLNNEVGPGRARLLGVGCLPIAALRRFDEVVRTQREFADSSEVTLAVRGSVDAEKKLYAEELGWTIEKDNLGI